MAIPRRWALLLRVKMPRRPLPTSQRVPRAVPWPSWSAAGRVRMERGLQWGSHPRGEASPFPSILMGPAPGLVQVIGQERYFVQVRGLGTDCGLSILGETVQGFCHHVGTSHCFPPHTLLPPALSVEAACQYSCASDCQEALRLLPWFQLLATKDPSVRRFFSEIFRGNQNRLVQASHKLRNFGAKLWTSNCVSQLCQ